MLVAVGGKPNQPKPKTSPRDWWQLFVVWQRRGGVGERAIPLPLLDFIRIFRRKTL